MSHQQMVLLGHNHCRTMTRDQVESHLTLCGWRPLSWGQAGAAKNDVVVYLTSRKVWDEGQKPYNIHVIWNQGAELIAKHNLDLWLWSDSIFWLLAHQCLELEACQHDGKTPFNGVNAWRCEKCHQLIG